MFEFTPEQQAAVEQQAQEITDASRKLAAKLLAEGASPLAVAVGFFGTALEVYRTIADLDTIRRLLHKAADSLLD